MKIGLIGDWCIEKENLIFKICDNFGLKKVSPLDVLKISIEEKNETSRKVL